jgi:hypothetical protein
MPVCLNIERKYGRLGEREREREREREMTVTNELEFCSHDESKHLCKSTRSAQGIFAS